MKTHKYQLGKRIRHKNDTNVFSGEIQHISIDATRVIYTIAVKDWDNERGVIDGVRHIEESDVVEV